jgi:tight adherence protein B
MSTLLDSSMTVILGIGACVMALSMSTYAILVPGQVRIARSRRRPDAAPTASPLAGAASLATAMVDRALRSNRVGGIDVYLERAAVKAQPHDVALLVIIGTVVMGALGFALAGVLVGILLAAFVPIGTKIVLDMRIKRRQKAFAGHLDDTLQLMASNLRAGHSLLQALAAVAREAEEPISDEFFRAINATRVGRDLPSALAETAERMDSQDFSWVTQAISINREVGGNLADVLDGVAHTIREREQIRRQVKALAAEGKLSAVVLMLLPVGITLFLMTSNPEYIGKFLEGPIGYALIGLALVLLTAGFFWLRSVVRIKF